MSKTRENRKLAVAAMASVAFVAPALCGLVDRASASFATISQFDAYPTAIAQETLPSATPWTTTGAAGSGYSTNYRNNGTNEFTNNGPNNLFNKGVFTATSGTLATWSNSYGSSGYTPSFNNGDGSGDQWEQNDINPVVTTTYANAISANGFVFAQRDTGAGDQVSQINIWFTTTAYTESYTPPNGAEFEILGNSTTTTAGSDSTPTGSANGGAIIDQEESITITTGTTALTEYAFPDGQTLNSKFVTIQFVNTAAVAQGAGNTGGAAFDFVQDPSNAPEPSMAALGMSALGLLGLRRRRRA